MTSYTIQFEITPYIGLRSQGKTQTVHTNKNKNKDLLLVTTGKTTTSQPYRARLVLPPRPLLFEPPALHPNRWHPPWKAP